MIIVVQKAPATFSRMSGGAATQPRRIPGKRLFDKLVTKTVRCGISAASGAFSGERNPYTSSSTTVRRYFSATAAICRRRRSLMIADVGRSEEHTSELQSLAYLVCRLLLEKKKNKNT